MSKEWTHEDEAGERESQKAHEARSIGNAMSAPVDVLAWFGDCSGNTPNEVAAREVRDAVAELIEHRNVIQQALANYAERCRSVAEQPAMFEVDRKRRDSHAESARRADAAIAALARVGGTA